MPEPAIALLANPDSGKGGAAHVERLLQAAGADVRTHRISQWREAAASSPDRIVVAGGDGSLGCAASAAARAAIPLAVIATGTANDFVAAVGLPVELEEACVLAVGGTRSRCLDLARAGSRPFLNVASVGLAPAAAEEAEGLKDRVGPLAYPVGAVRAATGAEPVRCRVACDGEHLFAGEAWQVSVASGGAFGGGSSLDADDDDGRLDLVVIEGGSRARLAKHAFGMRLGSLEGQEGVIVRRCARVELRIESEGESLNIDGEVIPAAELSDHGAIDFTIEPRAFELIVG